MALGPKNVRRCVGRLGKRKRLKKINTLERLQLMQSDDMSAYGKLVKRKIDRKIGRRGRFMKQKPGEIHSIAESFIGIA